MMKYIFGALSPKKISKGNKMNRVITGLFGLAIAGQAIAFPVFESDKSSLNISKNDFGGFSATIFLEDHDDSDLLYVPYDEVQISVNEDTERPIFNFSYGEDGGNLTFAVQASFKKSTLRKIQRKERDGYRVVPLPIESGGWTISAGGGTSSVTVGRSFDISTVFPTIPFAVSIELTKAQVKYILGGFRSGTALALNYHYKFKALSQTMSFKAEVNWSNYRNFVQEETVVATASCKSKSGSAGFFGIGSSSGSRSCHQTFSDLREITRVAVEDQVLKIYSVSNGGQGSKDKAIEKLTDLIISRQFKPIDSVWEPLSADIRASCSAKTSDSSAFGGMVSLNYSSAKCSSSSSAYFWNEETIIEDKSFTYIVESSGTSDYNGHVGGSLNVLCEESPELFFNVDTMEEGCGDYVMPDDRGPRFRMRR